MNTTNTVVRDFIQSINLSPLCNKPCKSGIQLTAAESTNTVAAESTNTAAKSTNTLAAMELTAATENTSPCIICDMVLRKLKQVLKVDAAKVNFLPCIVNENIHICACGINACTYVGYTCIECVYIYVS